MTLHSVRDNMLQTVYTDHAAETICCKRYIQDMRQGQYAANSIYRTCVKNNMLQSVYNRSCVKDNMLQIVYNRTRVIGNMLQKIYYRYCAAGNRVFRIVINSAAEAPPGILIRPALWSSVRSDLQPVI